MVRRYLDDLNGRNAKETVKFALDGKVYSIDLTAANAAKLRRELAHYIEAARRIANGNHVVKTPQSVADRLTAQRARSQAIRAWALANNITVNSRGSVSKQVTELYDQAQTRKPSRRH